MDISERQGMARAIYRNWVASGMVGVPFWKVSSVLDKYQDIELVSILAESQLGNPVNMDDLLLVDMGQN